MKILLITRLFRSIWQRRTGHRW